MKKLYCFLFLFLLAAFPAAAADESAAAEPGLLRLTFFRAGEMMPADYGIYLLGGDYFLYKNQDPPIRTDPALAAELVRIMDEYNVQSWDGFDESDENVLDGEFFGFSAALTNGVTIRADGDNSFPEHYFQASGEIEELLASAEGEEAEMDIFGTYVYENEGFGGDFTITVNEDETYSFYEGPLSSYRGGGSWFREKGVLYFFEENGMDLINHFAAGNGVLVFIETDSDNFPYIRLTDGSLFYKQ